MRGVQGGGGRRDVLGEAMVQAQSDTRHTHLRTRAAILVGLDQQESWCRTIAERSRRAPLFVVAEARNRAARGATPSFSAITFENESGRLSASMTQAFDCVQVVVRHFRFEAAANTTQGMRLLAWRCTGRAHLAV
jgi:hypothetical protein